MSVLENVYVHSKLSVDISKAKVMLIKVIEYIEMWRLVIPNLLHLYASNYKKPYAFSNGQTNKYMLVLLSLLIMIELRRPIGIY